MNQIKPVVLITGAGSGIGQAVAIKFAAQGYAIVATGRNLDNLEETLLQCNGEPGDHLAMSCDIGKPDQVERLFVAIEAKFGRLDVLFNNAGRFTPAVAIEDLTFDQWQSTVDANLTGAFLCCQGAIRMMKRQQPQGGRIINNGSISAKAPRPMSAPYTATKHAITGLTKSISLDCRPYRIACGQIDIGNAETPMTKKMPQGVPQANGEVLPEPVIDVDIVANAVYQMADLPLEANVQFITLMATTMPFIGRG